MHATRQELRIQQRQGNSFSVRGPAVREERKQIRAARFWLNFECMPTCYACLDSEEARSLTASAASGGRWLFAHAHTHNGLANRLSGVRGAYALALESGRKFSLSFFGSEGQHLRPAAVGWEGGRLAELLDGAKHGVGQRFSGFGISGARKHYRQLDDLPPLRGLLVNRSTAEAERATRARCWSLGRSMRMHCDAAVAETHAPSLPPSRRLAGGRTCAPMLFSPNSNLRLTRRVPKPCAQRDAHPRRICEARRKEGRGTCAARHVAGCNATCLCEPDEREELHGSALDLHDFRSIAHGPSPLVLVEQVPHDLGFGSRDGNASRHYRELFTPSPSFQAAACAHLRSLGLRVGQPWIGLQLRRTDERVWKPNAGANDPARLEEKLEWAELYGLQTAFRCADQLKAALCKREARMYVTSNSPLVRKITGERRPDAIWARTMDATHSASHDASSTLNALLELAVLSGSAAILGTAGSSFPAEAGRLGGVPVTLQRDFDLFDLNSGKRPPVDLWYGAEAGSTSSGECDVLPPTLTWEPRGSVLLPTGACAGEGSARGVNGQ